MRIPSGTTDQVIYFVAVDATDFTTRETGLSSFTVYRDRNGAGAAAMTTPTVGEVDATNMPGVYKLLLDEDMTIGAGNDSEEMVFHITHAGMAPVTRTIELYRPKITAGNTLDVTATGAAGIDWGNVENPSTSVNLSGTTVNLVNTATTVTNDVGVNEWNGVLLATTNPLPNAVAGASGGLWILGSNAGATSFAGTITYSARVSFSDGIRVSCTTLNRDGIEITGNGSGNDIQLTTNGLSITGGMTVDGITSNITGNLSGSVGTLTGWTTPADLVDLILDEPRAGHATAGTVGESFAQIVSGQAAATPTSSVIDTNLTETTDDHYKDRTLLFTSGVCNQQAKTITGYNGTTKELTTDPFTDAPSAGDTFIIV